MSVQFQIRNPRPVMVFLLALAVGLVPASALAQESLTGIAVPITLNFNSFDASGFTPSPAAGQLDSDTWSVEGMSDGDLAFGGTETSGDFARGTDVDGGVSTGGIYAFELGAASGDFTLGVQPGGSDMTPGTITLRVDNNTGDQVDEVEVTYDVYVNNNTARANTFNFSFASAAGGPYTSVPALNLTSTEASDAMGFQANNRMTTLTGLAANFQNGDSLFLRWELDDSTGSGARDEFALDNVVIEATVVPVELMSFGID